MDVLTKSLETNQYEDVLNYTKGYCGMYDKEAQSEAEEHLRHKEYDMILKNK